jgi:hypothetical protein
VILMKIHSGISGMDQGMLSSEKAFLPPVI